MTLGKMAFGRFSHRTLTLNRMAARRIENNDSQQNDNEAHLTE